MILNCWSYLRIVDTKVPKYTIRLSKFHIHDLGTSNEFKLDSWSTNIYLIILKVDTTRWKSFSLLFIMFSVASLLTVCAVASPTLLSVAWKACLPGVDVNLISYTWCFVRNWLTFFSLGVGLNIRSFWIYGNQSLEHGQVSFLVFHFLLLVIFKIDCELFIFNVEFDCRNFII